MKKQTYFILFLLWVSGINSQGQNPELRIPIGHYGQITDLQESPDGKLLASASADGTIKIWEKNSGLLLKTLTGHNKEVNSLDFSPDGKTIISGSSDNTVALWDVFLGQKITVLGSHEGPVKFVSYSPDGKYILSMAISNLGVFKMYHNKDIRKFLKTIGNEPIKIWNTSTKKEEDNLINHPTPIKLLYFLPNNDPNRNSDEFIHGGIVYGEKHRMNLLMIEKGILDQINRVKDLPTEQVLENYKVIYLPAQNQFITNNIDNGLEKWDVATNKFLGKIKIDSLINGTRYDSKINFDTFMDGTISTFQYFSNDKFTLLSSAQKILIIDKFRKETRFFEINTPEKKSYVSGNIESFESIILQLFQSSIGLPGLISQLKVLKDGQFMLGFSTGTIMLLAKNEIKLKEYEGDSQRNVSAVAWGENEQSFLTGHWDNFSRKFDLTNHKAQILHKHYATVNNIRSVTGYDFAASADLLTFSDIDKQNKTNMWGVDDVLLRRNESTPTAFQVNKEDNIVVCCNSQLSSRGKYIATYGKIDEFGGIYLFNVESQRLVRKLEYPKTNDIDDPEIAMFLAMRMMSGRFSLFDIFPTGNSIIFSKEDSLVAALTSMNTRIGVWNVNNGNLLKDINPKEKGLKAIAFSPNGNFLAYGGIDKRITLMNLSNDQKNSSVNHHGTIFCLQYSRDGKYLASGSEDQTIVIQDGNTGTYIKTLKGHTGSVNAIDFSKNGKYLLSGSDDHTTKIWDIETGKELASVIPVDSTDWVITSPEGWFDASPGAMQKMYYVQGLETFDLEQLKERYWVPGLLQELLGYTHSGLPPSIKDSRIPLPPNIKLSLKGDILTVKATKRDGGLGKIALFVDNIEVETDLRSQKTSGFAQGEFTHSVSLKNYQRFLGNGTNVLRIVAYEKSNQISTRGDTIHYVMTGKIKGIEPMVSSSGATSPKAEARVKKASFYGIMIGANTLGLRYASKDAEAMKQVVEKVAKSFIDTTHGKVRIALFSQSQPTAFQPTKANVVRYLVELQKMIKPEDLFCFFYSGHGKVFINKLKENDFAMLLQGIRQESTDLSQNTLSNFVETHYVLSTRNELTKLLNDLPARKKIIAIDACGSQTAAQLQTEALVIKQNRPNREKALDNMSSRTGIYFLASSGTDKASFEHTMYEHGFLTYSLLRGIKSGAATKFFGAEAYLDVSTWFKYAEADAPKVAAAVGQLQQPKFMTPKQTQDDIYLGIVDENIRHSVTLLEGNKLKVGKCIFHDEDLGDGLDISEKLNAQLREKAEESSDFWYEDTEGAFSLHGTYKRAVDGIIQLEINLFKGKTLLRKLGVIELKADASLIDHLKDKLLREAKQ